MIDALAWAGTFHGIGARLLRDYADQIGLDPNFADAWHNRGCYYVRMFQLDKAIPNFSKAIELDSKLAQAWHLRSLSAARSPSA